MCGQCNKFHVVAVDAAADDAAPEDAAAAAAAASMNDLRCVVAAVTPKFDVVETSKS